MSSIITFKTKEDAPNYDRAVSPATSCSNCQHFQARWCVEYDFNADPSYTCDSWARRTISQGAAAVVPMGSITKKADIASFTTFKDKKGQWRWVLKSSNAFEDREKQIVTTNALERDVQRTDKTGEYGPLRWWHVGNPVWRNPLDWRSVVAGKGLDIGDCDFSAMEGPILIESGTFRSEAIGEAISSKVDQFRASLGFSHPLDAPDRDGLYHHINRFERSLTPANRASNTRTGLVVTKERAMDPEKLTKFKEAVGEDIANQVLEDASLTTKEARAAGIREKSLEEPTLEEMEARLLELTEGVTKFKAFVEAKKGQTVSNEGNNEPVAPDAIIETKADEEPDGDESTDSGEDAEEIYIGDMTGPEFVGLLQNALGPMFESHTKALDLHGKISAANDAMKEMKSYMGGMTAKDDTLIEMKSQMEQMSITLKEAMEQLDGLNGDLPRELSAPRSTSYKASEAPNNTISLPSDTQDAQNLDPLSWIDQFVVRQQQTGTPVPQTVAVVPNRAG